MKKKQIDPYEKPMMFTTFQDPEFAVRRSVLIAPNVWNGEVHVRQYIVTIERMEEPKEVIRARLQKLFEESENHHEWGPLQGAAHSVGVELAGSPGAKRKKS